ncbi:hypothetical protein FJT64_002892 [Amphibalanus amphitrite]|uniref:Uncharacterized protein n=1 Tax=Amphibalanus amphitrite TaxID=1232801 RepID=A0A6A4WNH2_AMPAM|nr:hypothetical protein FJT64_002892 [Amphibalanus amphitrite]
MQPETVPAVADGTEDDSDDEEADAQATVASTAGAKYPAVLCTHSSTSCQLLTLGDLHEDAVRNLWSLEGVGIRSDEEPASSKVLEDFESSVSFSDGRLDFGEKIETCIASSGSAAAENG